MTANATQRPTARVEAERRESELQRDELLGAVLHDLQQPLAVVKGLAQLLRRRLERGDALELDLVLASLGDIEASANRMASEIADALDVGLVAQARPGPDRRPTNL